ncbi:hypothetical protein GIB67_028594 [Kingdonia uniflora]|uniref:Uncharacterized protein n=1 Tax=Kingdonia uniflora TaxID=39325 RepID=A0A7J7KZH5_9MAGN|nr:hypothetical protein GIB67_028594 [Kingdonia uniflora]
MLNKSILCVAGKYLERHTPSSLNILLSLGSKASVWCRKHLKATLASTEESQEEEHSSMFFQLVLELLSFFAGSFSALAASPVLEQKMLMSIVEEFIFEQLSLTKDLISEIKRIQSDSPKVLKSAHVVLSDGIKLCRTYFQAINLDSCGMKTDADERSMDRESVDNVKEHVINIIKCTIDNLYELGIFAAKDGGSLVSILNVSWKGVLSLLQLGNGVLAVKVDVADIIATLFSLATESLRCAAESWSSHKEEVATAEAKRAFFPVKFYLNCALKISSQCLCQALTVYKEMALCALMISTFSISLSKETRFKALSEALAEFLEPTSILLIHTLLKPVEVKHMSKLLILDWLFAGQGPPNSTHLKDTNIDEIFTFKCEDMPREKMLFLGRVVLFLNLLKSSPDLGEDVSLGISLKLGWLFDCLVDEDIYSLILTLRVPVLCSLPPRAEFVWQSIFPSVSHALKTFMIVASSSLVCWEAVEFFLLENFLQPHFLVWEIVMDLWYFFVRYAEIELINEIIDKLYSLLKFIASSEPVLMPSSALRKMARSISLLLTYAPPSSIDRIYNAIVADERSPVSSTIYVALLIEGFPLNLLTDKLKLFATQRIVTAYYSFIDKNDKKLLVDNMLSSCGSSVIGAPVYALSSALQCLQISSSEINVKTLKFAVTIVHGYRSATTDTLKMSCCKLLGQTLAIISNLKHLCVSDEIAEVILELQTLFCNSDNILLYQCKSDLAIFMAALGYMEVIEDEESATTSAVWQLYHVLLRERHWAFIHLALTGFGYFAARTSCNQLWRFVPGDAALSFNIDTGIETDEERFMPEFKGFLQFLEKEAVASCDDQLPMLLKEGLTLKETLSKKVSSIKLEDPCSEMMEIDSEPQANKKRKLPHEICEGMALLHSGLKVMGDGIAQWQKQQYDSTELRTFSTHISCLKDVIAHLTGLTGSEL